MKISSFFKILKRKIDKYDRITSNPFLENRHVIIIWVEEDEDKPNIIFESNN
ncbi:hypothetical protein IJO12_00660 [bacterium]|nr:hypothetical protein [bacterium]